MAHMTASRGARRLRWGAWAIALGLATVPVTGLAQQGAGKGKPAAPAGTRAPKGPPGKAQPPIGAPAPEVKVDVAATRAELVAGDADKAEAAAKRLGQTRQAGALDALLDGLAMGLAPKVAVVALDAVGAHRSAAAIDVLALYARHRSPEVRGHAVAALGAIDDRRARGLVWNAFHDGDVTVRAAACKVAEITKDRSASESLVALLVKGDAATAPALAAIATPDLARALGELIGQAPDDLLARTLGLVLLRPDFGKEEAYVEVVVTLGKIPGEESLVALTNFVSAVPENPPRLSRRKAQELYELRLSGGN